jgi:hypothetical protein
MTMTLGSSPVLSPAERAARRRAALTRGLKVFGYTVAGWGIASALGLFVYAATKFAWDAQLIAIATPVVAGIVGAAHKALTWKAAPLGIALPDIPGTTGGTG